MNSRQYVEIWIILFKQLKIQSIHAYLFIFLWRKYFQCLFICLMCMCVCIILYIYTKLFFNQEHSLYAQTACVGISVWLLVKCVAMDKFLDFSVSWIACSMVPTPWRSWLSELMSASHVDLWLTYWAYSHVIWHTVFDF